MLKQYPTEIKLVYKSYPIPGHGFARQAALAAFAAGEQGKFWQMHDALFENYQSLNEGEINRLAEQIGLDMPAFQKSKNDPGLVNHIQADLRSGKTVGVKGTPTVFINGKQLNNMTLRGFDKAIEKALKVKNKS